VVFFSCVNVRGKEIQNVHESLLQLLMFVFLKNIFVLAALKSLVTGFQHLRDGQILTGAL
jgi:hypothetical protein